MSKSQSAPADVRDQLAILRDTRKSHHERMDASRWVFSHGWGFLVMGKR